MLSLRHALEGDAEAATIVMKGPLSEIYTQALNVAYAKDVDVPVDGGGNVIEESPIKAVGETDAGVVEKSNNAYVSMEAIREKKKADKKKKVAIKVKKGSFHEWLGKKPGDPITDSDIQRGLKSNDPHVRKMAQFAKNAKKWHQKKKVANESFDIVAFDNIIMETQQMDVAIMQKLAASMNDSDVAPTDNFQTVYGVSKDCVTNDDIVNVISELEKSNNHDFYLVLDATTPVGDDTVSERIIELEEPKKEESDEPNVLNSDIVPDNSNEAAPLAAALESIVLANGGKVLRSLKEFIQYQK